MNYNSRLKVDRYCQELYEKMKAKILILKVNFIVTGGENPKP